MIKTSHLKVRKKSKIKIGNFVSIDKDGFAYKPIDGCGNFKVIEVINKKKGVK